MLDQAFDDLKTYDWGVDPKVLKPIDDAVYTWDFHRNTMLRFVERLDSAQQLPLLKVPGEVT